MSNAINARPWLRALAAGPLALVIACGGATPQDASGDPGDKPGGPGDDVSADMPTTPGAAIDVRLDSPALTALEADLADVKTWDSEDLGTHYPVRFAADLPFDPTTAAGYDAIQASGLALSPGEAEAYATHGFVISRSRSFATFSYGYHSVYADDLPVYISADSVLDALHRSYDDILKDLELELLIPTFARYLGGMRARLPAAEGSTVARAHADFLLAMAESLLEGRTVAPAFEGSFEPSQLSAFFEAAQAAAGIQQRELFGFTRRIDFSQFKPRGHYTDEEALERYFRAMMWLGRIDLRMIETLDDGSQVLRRDQVAATVLLRTLMDEGLFADWSLIDRAVTAFVGEHDYLAASQVDALMGDLGIDKVTQLDDISDDALSGAILAGGYGEQRIASHVMRQNDPFAPTLPLNVSFALFGQRYVVDSHVFSQVVYDRVSGRVLPDPLDAAFAALGNNQALSLLEELDQADYARNLGAMRSLVDAHPQASWEGSLYMLWLDALRQLSPGGAPGQDATVDLTTTSLPAVAQTEPWGRRLLSTQLGSWAQLRHDTLLYAKQSYTSFSSCEYPAAYVDPYPAFWAKLLAFAERGALLVDSIEAESAVLTAVRDYFERFTEIVSVLHAMSEHQRTGMPHSADHMAFINQAVLINGGGSGPPTIEGWYHRLLYQPEGFSEVDLTVADVHTDPGGVVPFAREASVLHVGTSYPRLLVTAIEGCEGPQAYAGPVFTYKEHLAQGVTRLDDEQWTELVNRDPTRDTVPEVPWLNPLYGSPPPGN